MLLGVGASGGGGGAKSWGPGRGLKIRGTDRRRGGEIREDKGGRGGGVELTSRMY